MVKVKLRCAVHGEATLFFVKIERDAKVSALQDAILYKNRYEKLFKVDSRALTLYLARKAGRWLKDDASLDVVLHGEIDNRLVKMCQTQFLDSEELLGSNFEPEDEVIHVLVKLSESKQNAAKVVHYMPAINQDWTAKWLCGFRKSQIAPHHLPPVKELAAFIERELPVKIALHKLIRDNWMGKMKTPSSVLMAKIFLVENSEPCVEFLNQVVYRVVHPMDPGDTWASFISFWDDLIRHVLNFTGIGKSGRLSSRSSFTGPPDFQFFVDSVCVFRGQESAPGQLMETTRRKLFENLVWNYGDARICLVMQPSGMKSDCTLSPASAVIWTLSNWERMISKMLTGGFTFCSQS